MPKPVKSVLEGGLSEKAMKGMKQTSRSNGKPKKGGEGSNGAEKSKKGDVVAERFGTIDTEVKARKFKTKKGIRIQVYQDVKTNPGDLPAMNAEQAIDLIGWETLDEGKFLLKDIHGTKVRLVNNSTNRPFRPGLARRYMSEIIRNVWRLNGESIIFDWDNKCQSGQHRLCGFILACQLYKKDPAKWKKYWTKPPTMECLVVHDINPSDEVVNTIDQGQKRTPGDVIFRSEIFGAGSHSLGEQVPAMGEKTRQRLSNILGGAVRLVWLRAGGKSISDAPHFPMSELMSFIYDHPKLVEYTYHAYALEGGEGKSGGKITKFPLSIAQVAGLLYLMAVSHTDPQEWVDNGVDALDFKNEAKAKEFWAKFCKGAELKADDPIFVLREMLPQMEGGSGMGRDKIVSTVIRAFNAYMDKQPVKAKDLAIKMSQDKNGRPKLGEYPILGGIDMGNEKLEKAGEDAGDTTPSEEQEGKMHGKSWSEGDTCWVYDEDGSHWFGTIDETYPIDKSAGGGKGAFITDAETGRQWDVNMSVISLKYPG